MNFRTAVLRYEVGLLRADELPQAAVKALEEGLDSDALRVLAAYSVSDYEASAVLGAYRRALAELRMPPPDRHEAAYELLEQMVEAAAASSASAYAEAKRAIDEIYYHCDFCDRNSKYVGDSLGIERLYSLVDSYDDLAVATHQWQGDKSNAELLADLSEEIRVEAGRLVGERPWRRRAAQEV